MDNIYFKSFCEKIYTYPAIGNLYILFRMNQFHDLTYSVKHFHLTTTKSKVELKTL